MLISKMLRMGSSAIVLVLLVVANSSQETKGRRTNIILRITAKQNVITYARQTSIAWLKRYYKMKNTLFFRPIMKTVATGDAFMTGMPIAVTLTILKVRRGYRTSFRI